MTNKVFKKKQGVFLTTTNRCLELLAVEYLCSRVLQEKERALLILYPCPIFSKLVWERSNHRTLFFGSTSTSSSSVKLLFSKNRWEAYFPFRLRNLFWQCTKSQLLVFPLMPKTKHINPSEQYKQEAATSHQKVGPNISLQLHSHSKLKQNLSSKQSFISHRRTSSFI